MNSKIILFFILFIASCATTGDQAEYAYEKTTPANTFSLLVYNIAGLPQIASGVEPEKNILIIGSLLNRFDIALVQEDFAYHHLLDAHEKHQFKSEYASCHSLYCDGLSVFSFCPFRGFTRIPWRDCWGIFVDASDCLTPKGFAFARFEPEEGVFVDIYDLHMDAGWSDGDKRARESQFLQLTKAVLGNSAGHPIIIAGDFNSRYAYQSDFIDIHNFMKACGLSDAAVILGRDYDRIDKVFYRSGPGLTLTPVEYKVEEMLFVNPEAKPLSDHAAISVLFGWKKN